MKAIIIAAGMGSRLYPLTKDKPKCMLEINGKTLLQYQIDALKGAGIDKISVIKGYKEEIINYRGITYYINDNYKNNNILHSLFYAEKEMEEEFIAVYSDIFYTKNIVEQLIEIEKDISIVVDEDWRGYYEGRKDHPIDEAENVIFDSDKCVVKIGKALQEKHIVHGEFIGMMKCSKNGALVFKRHFNRLRETYSNKQFQSAPIFEKAYLTDMIQDLVDSQIPVHCVTIKGGWREIDTLEDYKKASNLF